MVIITDTNAGTHQAAGAAVGLAAAAIAPLAAAEAGPANAVALLGPAAARGGLRCTWDQ